MNMEHAKQDSRKSFGKTFIQMLVGGGMGFGSILLFNKFVGVKWLAENVTPAGMIAFAVAGIFIMIAAIVLIMSFSKKMLTYNRISADMDDEEFAETRPINRWSGMGMLIYAAAFIMLALGNSSTEAPQTVYFWAVVVCMVAQLGIGWYLWMRFDELWRDVTKEASAISFTIIEIVLFVWAAASIFGFGISFDPLAVVVTTTSIYTLITVLLTARKGMTA